MKRAGFASRVALRTTATRWTASSGRLLGSGRLGAAATNNVLVSRRGYAPVTEADLQLDERMSPALKARLAISDQKPQTLAEFASKWQSESPELAQSVKEIDQLFDELESKPMLSFSPNAAYLHDVQREALLGKLLARPATELEQNLVDFWAAYLEAPSSTGKTTEPVADDLDDLKAVLRHELPGSVRRSLDRVQKSKGILKYFQGSKEAALEHLPQLVDPSKLPAIKKELAAEKDALKQDAIIKKYLGWSDAEKQANELIQRHPDFKELHYILRAFPPFVKLIGEPSVFQYKLKQAVNKSFAKWKQTASPAAPSLEQEDTYRDLRELIVGGLSKEFDAAQELKAKKRELQLSSPDLLYSHELTQFSKHLKSDSEFLDELERLTDIKNNEFPNSSDVQLFKDFDTKLNLWEKQIKEVVGLQQAWVEDKSKWVEARIQDGLQEADKYYSGTVDGILALHPEWEKEIEDDIANDRWDPEIPRKEYEHARHHYFEHSTHHA